ncbi:MAG: hypothetical protein ACJ735_09815 [Actinomycetes bacterium]
MTKVYIERGTKRVFACAYDWPGWCRSAKDEAGALEVLADYADRYRVIAEAAGLRFPKAAAKLEVVDRVKGDGATDFGVPHKVAPQDNQSVTAAQAKKYVAIVEATWSVFADVVAGAPAKLRKGPRGGGRDRDAIAAHVTEAEKAYARKLGIPKMSDADELHAAIVDVIRNRPDDVAWPIPYAVRRIAWHVIDHAWEIQDKSS